MMRFGVPVVPLRVDVPPGVIVLLRHGGSSLLWDPEADEVWWA